MVSKPLAEQIARRKSSQGKRDKRARYADLHKEAALGNDKENSLDKSALS